MSAIKVYHAQNTRDSFFYINNGTIYNKKMALDAFQNNQYDLAAEMNTSEAPLRAIGDTSSLLEWVYKETNNIDGSWIRGRVGGPKRSTSVGDIIAIDDDIHIVASFGFELLNDF